MRTFKQSAAAKRAMWAATPLKGESAQPAPAPAPQTTKRTSSRVSREAQRNAKAELAYRNMRYIGGVAGQPTHEQWTVASTSQADVVYTVTHDLAHDRYRCSCLAGQHDRECVHVLAAQRKVNDRRAAYERDKRAGGYGYNDTYDLHYGTQATSDY